MGIMIKHSLKNIFAKPFRLLLLVFCITFASFTALLAVDMRNNISSLMRGYMIDMIGQMDILAYGTSSESVEGLDEIAALKKVGLGSVYQYEYETDPSGYEYSYETMVEVVSISDYAAAYDMSYFPKVIELDDQSAVITKDYADTFGTAIGDTITLQTRDEVDIELNVKDVVDIKNTFVKGEAVFVTNTIVKRIACTRETDYDAWIIDVEDDAKVTEVADALRQADPSAELEVLQEIMDDPDIDQIYNLFYLLFLISFLLVIFVTVSMAEKIVNERMSVIGTLRSLGVAPGATTWMLLIENIMYAVIGTGIGIFLYTRVKPVLLNAMINLSETGRDPKQYIGATPVWVYLLVLLGAILVECAYPLYELTRAVKTPIRDIIFDNKDTAFQYRWGRLYAGIVLGVAALVTGLLVKNFVTLAISLACGIIALAVLIPFLIRIISKGITAVCKKLSLPVAQLAAENISRNRIVMGTAVLCVTSLTLSLLIGCMGETMGNDLEKSEYDCDVIVDISLNDDYHNYRYIGAVEGVEDTDFIYRTLSTMKLGEDKQRSIYVLADTQHTMLEGLPAEGFDLKENEIVISNAAAQRLGINIGDEITITIDPDTDFPIEKQMIVKETLNMEKIESLGTWTVIMNTDVYTHLFGGKILGMVLVKCADPDAVKERIEKCSESTALSVETLAEKTAMEKDSTSGLLLVIRLIVAGSAGLTLIGIAGNQSLGFLTRKRENALLYSVALPRGGLKKMLFLESVFSMGISAVIAAITAPFLYGVLGHLLDVIGDGDINILEQGMAATTKGLLYLGVILVVYLMTTLIPFKYLRKMNIAEELKYE